MPADNSFRWSWQKALILSVSVLMAAFGVGIFWQVQSVPDIALHTTLRNVVNRADSNYLRTEDGQLAPELKDLLREANYEQLGDDRVETYPQLLDARARLGHVTFVDRAGLP